METELQEFQDGMRHPLLEGLSDEEAMADAAASQNVGDELVRSGVREVYAKNPNATIDDYIRDLQKDFLEGETFEEYLFRNRRTVDDYPVDEIRAEILRLREADGFEGDGGVQDALGRLRELLAGPEDEPEHKMAEVGDEDIIADGDRGVPEAQQQEIRAGIRESFRGLNQEELAGVAQEVGAELRPRPDGSVALLRTSCRCPSPCRSGSSRRGSTRRRRAPGT